MDALMEEVDLETEAPEMQAYLELRGRLRSTDLWPFMKTERITGSDLVPGAWESYLKDVLEAPGLTWRRSSSTSIPRSFGRERYLLHFFSGRRRAGDLQFYLDQFSTVDFVLHTVSIDIVVDSALGDLMSMAAQDYWLRAIRRQFGSESSKPTALLCANLHNIRHHLRTHQLWKTPPASASIGMDSQGNFRTAKLKEYPPALNRALAGSFFEAVSNLPMDVGRVVDSDFRERCSRLLCAEYGTSYGPDFAPH
eukprot:symbB.v1.2.040279.t1/scaffold7103.1/size15193/2